MPSHAADRGLAVTSMGTVLRTHSRVRLVDVAATAGVHVSTVSRVLNEDPGLSIRDTTRDRILTAARRTGYRPNVLAQALQRSRTGALAMVVPMVRNPIWSVVERGAIDRAASRGFAMLLVSEPADAPRPSTHYAPLVEQSRVDGLVLANATGARSRSATALAVPHVYLNRRGNRPGHDVVMDEEGAVALFLQEVDAARRRSVVLIDGPRDIDTVRRRSLAARRLGSSLGLRVRVVHAAATEAGGWESTERVLGGGVRPDAIGVGSLPQLHGVVARLRVSGVRIQAQLSLVSFDEDDCLPYLGIPITSVAMPLAELGAAGVDAVLDQIAGLPARDVLVDAPMRLVRHDSSPTRRPPDPALSRRGSAALTPAPLPPG